MWILRFHLLKTKQYNKINRICKKYGFITRSHSSITYAKASVKHMTQKTSWRTLAREYGVDHNSLYKFHNLSKNTPMLEEILHVFSDARIALYIGDMKHIDTHYLDNAQEVLDLTNRRLKSMLMTS